MQLTRNERRAGLALVTGLALVWLVPVAMMLAVAFMPPGQRAPAFGGLAISGVSLANFQTVFQDAPILRHLLNSLVITGASVALVVLLGSLAAYGFSRVSFRGKEACFYLLILTLMLPIPGLIVPLFQINKQLGMLDSYLGLILPYTALGTPFAIIVLRSFFDTLPREMADHHAAQLAGGVSGGDLPVHDLVQRVHPGARHHRPGRAEAAHPGAADLFRPVHGQARRDVRRAHPHHPAGDPGLRADAALHDPRADLGRGEGLSRAAALTGGDRCAYP
jgi:hypothetical protein